MSVNILTNIPYIFDNLSGTVSPNVDGSLTSNITNPSSPFILSETLILISILIITILMIMAIYQIIKYQRIKKEN